MIPLIAAAAASVIGGVVKSGQSVKAAQTGLKTAQAQTDSLRAAFEMEKTKLAQIQAASTPLQATEQPTEEQAKKKKILLYGGIAAGALLVIGVIIFFVTRSRK